MPLTLLLALITPSSALELTASRPNGPVDTVSDPTAFGDVNDAETYRRRARVVRFRVADVGEFAQLDFRFRVIEGGSVGPAFQTADNFVRCTGWSDEAGPGEVDVCWRAPIEAMYAVEVSDGVSTAVAEVPVFDLWVASIGDSYSSGEGNPDVRSVPGSSLGDGYTSTEPRWRDPDCHRSHHAWPFQVAEAIQDQHPDTQVLFTFVPCSGAKIRPDPKEAHSGGLLGSYGGVWGDAALPPQLEVVGAIQAATGPAPDASDDELAQFGYVGAHAPDVLLMTAGGNDAGFADVVEQCMRAPCYGDLAVAERLGALRDAAAELASALDGMEIPYEQRLHLEYPDFTTVEGWESNYGGRYDIWFDDDCWSGNLDHLTDDIDDADERDHGYPNPPRTIGKNSGDRDFAQVYNELIHPASSTLRASGTGRYVEGPKDLFWGHGICAQEDRWIRNLEESVVHQNYIDDAFNLIDYRLDLEDPRHNLSTFGAYHPNETGHDVMAQTITQIAEATAANASSVRRPDLWTDVWIDGQLLDPGMAAWNDDLFVISSPDPRVTHRILVDGVPMDGGEADTGRMVHPGNGTAIVTVEREFVVPNLPPIPLPAITFPLIGGTGFDVRIVHEGVGYVVPGRSDAPEFHQGWTWIGEASLQPTSVLGPVDVTLTEIGTGAVLSYRASGLPTPPAAQFVGPGEYSGEFCIADTARCGWADFTVRADPEGLREGFYVEFMGSGASRRFDYDPSTRDLVGWPNNLPELTNDVHAYVSLPFDAAWAEVLDVTPGHGDALGRSTYTSLDLMRGEGEHTLSVTACVNPLLGCVDGFGFGAGEVLLLRDVFVIEGSHSSTLWWWGWWNPNPSLPYNPPIFTLP